MTVKSNIKNSGPASALYGDSQPGGVVNLVTKKPTKTPQHSVTLTGGTQSFVQAGLDISDNLTEDGSQRFRLVAMGNREDSFVNGVNGWRGYIAPSWTIDISKNTSLTLMASYLKEDRKPSAAFMPAGVRSSIVTGEKFTTVPITVIPSMILMTKTS